MLFRFESERGYDGFYLLILCLQVMIRDVEMVLFAFAGFVLYCWK